MVVLSMSDGELRRIEVLRDVDRGGLPVRVVGRALSQSVSRLSQEMSSDTAYSQTPSIAFECMLFGRR
jgi:hypothetical protein